MKIYLGGGVGEEEKQLIIEKGQLTINFDYSVFDCSMF